MKQKYIDIIINSILGLAICIILGLIFFGTNIFNYKSHALTVVIFGVVGSVFYSVLKYGSKKEIIFISIMLFLANIVFLGKPLTFTYLLRDLLFFVSLFSSLILYNYFIKKYHYSPLFIRALALSLFLGLLNLAVTIVLILVFSDSKIDPIHAILLNSKYGAIIGLGLGIGFDLFTKFRKSRYLL